LTQKHEAENKNLEQQYKLALWHSWIETQNALAGERRNHKIATEAVELAESYRTRLNALNRRLSK
jgi:hypothetical protein